MGLLQLPGRVLGFASAAAEEAVLDGLDRVLALPFTAKALDRILTGPLIEAAAQGIDRHAVVERVAAPVLTGPAFDRMIVKALESDGAERVLAQLLESRLLDDLVEQLLESEDFWRLVEGVTRSPEVTHALTRTSRGLADEVAAQVRTRSSGADAWLERAARRVGPHRGDDGLPAQTTTGP